jgi:hypothetical protein
MHTRATAAVLLRDAWARSAKLIQGRETGTVRLVGMLPSLETQATLWQAGTHQPDCLAALTVAFDVLTHGAGMVHIANPLDIERQLRIGHTDRRRGCIAASAVTGGLGRGPTSSPPTTEGFVNATVKGRASILSPSASAPVAERR